MSRTDIWTKTKDLGLPSTSQDIIPKIQCSPDRTRVFIALDNFYVVDLTTGQVHALLSEQIGRASGISALYNADRILWIDNDTLLCCRDRIPFHHTPFLSIFKVSTSKETILETIMNEEMFQRKVPALQLVGHNVYFYRYGLCKYNTHSGEITRVSRKHIFSCFAVCPNCTWACMDDIERDEQFITIWNLKTDTRHLRVCKQETYKNIKEMQWSRSGTRVFIGTEVSYPAYQANISVWDITTNKIVTTQIAHKRLERTRRWSPCDRFIVGVNKFRVIIRDSRTLAIHSKILGNLAADWVFGSPTLLTGRFARDTKHFLLEWYRYPSIARCRYLLMAVFSGILHSSLPSGGFLHSLLNFFNQNPGLLRLVGGQICYYLPFTHDRRPTGAKYAKLCEAVDVVDFVSLFQD